MNKDQVIYSLRLSFQDFMDADEELREEFEKLNEEEQSKFIARTQNSISNGMDDGMDYTTVMGIVANMMSEELLRVGRAKYRCKNCGFDMGEGYVNCGMSEDGTCPECGTESN